eukprot:1403322-Lingulodinium_polyedra.AAC.1
MQRGRCLSILTPLHPYNLRNEEIISLAPSLAVGRTHAIVGGSKRRYSTSRGKWNDSSTVTMLDAAQACACDWTPPVAANKDATPLGCKGWLEP